jgi:hypothetical protein
MEVRMPEYDSNDEPTYWERTDTLTQFEDFVSDAILDNMNPPSLDNDDELVSG